MAQSLSLSGNQRQQGFKGIRGTTAINLIFFLYSYVFCPPIGRATPGQSPKFHEVL
jgi:hypothetical protein